MPTTQANNLTATLNNYAPTQGATITLNVSGEGYEGLPFTASVKYKSKSTTYTGVVGEPCSINISQATIGFEVKISITVTDSVNNQKYQLSTSFTPIAKQD